MIASVALYGGAVATALGVAAASRPPAALGSRAYGVALAVIGIALAGAALAWPARERRVDAPHTPLDAFMPRYQFAERHVAQVSAPPAVTYAALLAVTADEIHFFRTLTWIRRAGRRGPASLLNAPANEPILAVATRTGFHPLASVPGRALVFGAFGAVTPAARAQVRGPFARFDSLATAAAFATLDAPGFAKIALDFRVEPDGRGGSVVSTETRVLATDDVTRRRFAAYWRAIYPGSAIIRRSWLAAIRRRAERSVTPR